MYQPYHTDTAFPLLLLIPDSILAVDDTIDFTHFVDAHDMKLTKCFVINIIRRRKQVRQLAKLNCNLEEQTSQSLFCTIDLRFHCFGNHRRDIVDVNILTEIADIKLHCLFNKFRFRTTIIMCIYCIHAIHYLRQNLQPESNPSFFVLDLLILHIIA